jgi:hypothetical protein
LIDALGGRSSGSLIANLETVDGIVQYAVGEEGARAIAAAMVAKA